MYRPRKHRPRERWRPAGIVLVIIAIGVLITLSATWISWTLNRNNDHRLLAVQTRQAGAVINSTVIQISSPLESALAIATATDGDTGRFSRSLAAVTGRDAPFVSAALWKADGSTVEQVASVGEPPALPIGSSKAIAFITLARRSPTFIVTPVETAGAQRVAYAVADPADPTYVVYAERAIPANRRVSAESNTAFADLDYATYLGTRVDTASLETTDVPLSELPLKGPTARDVIPFGDTRITLIARSRSNPDGSLGAFLPWIFLVGGGLLTLATAAAAQQLVRRRRAAEQDARTIADLYREVDGLYTAQRTIAETLQRALLPASNPEIVGLETASRYVAGAAGVDIGGDWYSILPVGESHFAFAVGDVSGRGVRAAAIMARMRFTMRAYLLEGHPPDKVLEMCSRQLDLSVDGHFATVVVGLGDLVRREITIANAGHLSPLIISDDGAVFVETEVGIPLGVAPTAYSAQTSRMPAGSTLICFTDGLVERRGESIDDGLERLRVLAAATASTETTVDNLLTRLLTGLTSAGSEDDVAVLAFKWTGPGGGN